MARRNFIEGGLAQVAGFRFLISDPPKDETVFGVRIIDPRATRLVLEVAVPLWWETSATGRVQSRVP